MSTTIKLLYGDGETLVEPVQLFCPDCEFPLMTIWEVGGNLEARCVSCGCEIDGIEPGDE